MKRPCCFAMAVFCFLGTSTWGQVIILPPDRHPIIGSYAVQTIGLDVTVKDRVAQVQMTQVFRNTSRSTMEVSFLFPVPPDSAISQLTLMVDGREVPAKVYSKEEARRIYEDIVRTKRDPALLEFLDYGLLQTSVFPLPAGGERKVTFRYVQVVRRERDVTELLIPLTAGKLSAKPIEELRITARIESPQAVKAVYSPTYPIDVERPDNRSAVVRMTRAGFTPADDFRLIWTLSEQPIGAAVLSYRPSSGDDGYFLLLANPEVKAGDVKAPPKTVIFVLDRSGSMSGKKIEQARNALKFVLGNLRPEDTFNIIAYDDRVESFKPELQRFDDTSRTEALRFVDGIYSGGSTNIDAALRMAMDMVTDSGRPSYVLFLTDGLPTTGETNETKIAANCKTANRFRARLFAFGVGYDVNARLIDRLTGENAGTSEFVRPNEDIEAGVSKFYARMSVSVLTDLQIQLAGTDVNRTYPRQLPDLFAGGQLVWVGRYRTSGSVTLKLTGKVGTAQQTYEFPVSLAAPSADESNQFVAKLWAVRRIGAIIEDIDLKGQNKELIDELVALSTEYGILTPYTSFLADERTDVRNRMANAPAAKRSLEALGYISGKAAVEQRTVRSKVFDAAQAAPAAGGQTFITAEGEARDASNVQVFGNKALYQRAGRWIDPSVTPEDEKKAEVVEQFSDRYFALARANAPLRQYLALPAGCTVRIGGNVYQINPPPQR